MADSNPDSESGLNPPADNPESFRDWLSYESEMACRAEASAKAGGKCWTTFRESERPHFGKLSCGGTGSSNAPVRLFRHMFCDARFTVGQPDHFPEFGLPSRSSKRPAKQASIGARLRFATARQSRSRCASSEGW